LKTRIFEIFTSIEGEGILYGTKTLFVRLAGCPYTCFYCDTLDALPLDSGKEYSITEACNLIDNNLQDNTYKVNFTGGEPLIQHEAVNELAKHVQARGLPTMRLSMNLQNTFKLEVFQRILNLHVLIQKNFYMFYHTLILLK